MHDRFFARQKTTEEMEKEEQHLECQTVSEVLRQASSLKQHVEKLPESETEVEHMPNELPSHIILRSYQHSEWILDDCSPTFIVMYDPDYEFLRRVEVHQCKHCYLVPYSQKGI